MLEHNKTKEGPKYHRKKKEERKTLWEKERKKVAMRKLLLSVSPTRETPQNAPTCLCQFCQNGVLRRAFDETQLKSGGFGWKNLSQYCGRVSNWGVRGHDVWEMRIRKSAMPQ